MSTFARKLSLWRMLSTSQEGVRLKDLANRLGVSKPTIQRDLDDLGSAGVPIEERQVGQTNLFFLRASLPPKTTLGRGEALALEAAAALLAPYRGKALSQGLQSVRAKTRAAPAVFEGRRVTGARIAAEEVMATLLEGVLTRRRCRVSYAKQGGKTLRNYLLEPYRFRLIDGLVYLDARVPPHEGLCTFVTSRLRTAAITEETFPRPSKLPANAFGVFEGKPEPVEVWFHPEIAPYIAEKRWHPSQRLAWKRDGSLVFTARVSGLYEFVGWVMSWGDRAELRRPAPWRAELVRRVEGLRLLYGRPSPREAAPSEKC